MGMAGQDVDGRGGVGELRRRERPGGARDAPRERRDQTGGRRARGEPVRAQLHPVGAVAAELSAASQHAEGQNPRLGRIEPVRRGGEARHGGGLDDQHG